MNLPATDLASSALLLTGLLLSMMLLLPSLPLLLLLQMLLLLLLEVFSLAEAAADASESRGLSRLQGRQLLLWGRLSGLQ